MKMNEMMKISMAVILVGGLVSMVGCGGKKEVKPEPTPEVVAAPTPEATPTDQHYSVVRGDTLWDISGQSDIYADNFQWPLIYKANRDQIQDPDIIEVGQDFVISRQFADADVQDAIEKAKRTPRYVPHTTPRQTLPIQY